MANWVNDICKYCNDKGLPACICGNRVIVWDSIVGERKVEFDFTTLERAKREIDSLLA